jgi:hypothetical protein
MDRLDHMKRQLDWLIGMMVVNVALTAMTFVLI